MAKRIRLRKRDYTACSLYKPLNTSLSPLTLLYYHYPRVTKNSHRNVGGSNNMRWAGVVAQRPPPSILEFPVLVFPFRLIWNFLDRIPVLDYFIVFDSE